MSPARLSLTPLKELEVIKRQIPAHGLIPNTSIQNKPLLIYKGAFRGSGNTVSASAIESHLSSVGIVSPQWRYTMYSTTHFHSTTHEILCIAEGRAKLCFGGEQNPGRLDADVKAGDVVVVPAGVGHRLMTDVDGGFEMVGSYPRGAKSWDMCYGTEEEKGKIERIKELGWFGKDPVYGEEGPAVNV
ncbi:hypothetical protein L228DRAFT_246244 [Xylona heveae TC161]|uniref:Cupin type-2 domain-containing protein n=1 Tax=Xylona heveae (strain CBS 132557 / TC161) TaxID=1328760 RepID=A0A165HGE9_XYLHT|nr:hypothetical protein L228DRAFT_246244 [Xylona heveae TC161]KZF23472.1 hypothetical protein L228DRAFT_246244 [Xylona heveae TC161]